MHIPSHPVHTAAHCNPLQLSAANHPVHIQCTHTTAMYSYVQPSAAICNHHLQCTIHNATICNQYYPVHTAAILSSAHCSYTIQCTLQLYYPVHTAATLSGANTIQCIQCTSGPPQGKPIPLLAYLQSSQQTLIHWLIVAVPKMKKTG